MFSLNKYESILFQKPNHFAYVSPKTPFSGENFQNYAILICDQSHQKLYSYYLSPICDNIMKNINKL